jgi:hypothetical protein
VFNVFSRFDKNEVSKPGHMYKHWHRKMKHLYTMLDFKVSYHGGIILLEDFIEYKGHPYVFYNHKGEVLETNMLDCEKPMYLQYQKAASILNRRKRLMKLCR